MAFRAVGMIALAAIVSAQSGIGYYGHDLQKQHYEARGHQPAEYHAAHHHVDHPQVQHHYQPQIQVHHQPQHLHQLHHEDEHHAPAHYQFKYDVHDDHTGDVHGQQESREGDKTEGQYYLIDADGHKRTVTYYVHGKSGFIAQVHREPVKGYQAQHQQQQHHHQQQHKEQHHHLYQHQ